VLIGSLQLDVQLDDLRVRKYAIPEPTTSVGNEEAL
jgi:hypothetical protein